VNIDQINNYAIDKMKNVIFQENCVEVVIVDMMKELDVNFAVAEAAANHAFVKWSEAYDQ
jgi:hypothetical protein